MGVEKQKPQAASLVNMIGYQDGSVVSREIVRKKAGIITFIRARIGFPARDWFGNSKSRTNSGIPIAQKVFLGDKL